VNAHLDLYRGYPTIRQDWDRYYREFPDRSARFALSSSSAVEEIDRLFGLTGTCVLDIASGTGKSTFAIARYAKEVVGIDPWIEMRGFAIEKQRRLAIDNVAFIDGVSDKFGQFAESEFDRVISTFGAPFEWDADECVEGCLRVTRRGGYVAFVHPPPGWTREGERSGTLFCRGLT
jgi:ubiquinone/menaquinone biosynthesis C-methylase UbiE